MEIVTLTLRTLRRQAWSVLALEVGWVLLVPLCLVALHILTSMVAFAALVPFSPWGWSGPGGLHDVSTAAFAGMRGTTLRGSWPTTRRFV